jgi:signal transduction histidine kinase
MGPLAKKHHNTLTVSCPEDIGAMYGDVMKTRQILLNLLGNATKFTKNGTIALDVRRSTVAGADAVLFSVTDTGVGMTPEQSSRIFDAFTQADITTTRQYGGTGLGLTIVSRFCEMMGGGVSVESRPGQGSCFTVHLPMKVVGSEERVPVVAL